VFYGSTVNTDKKSSGGNVNMNFTRLVSRVHFACKNSMEDGQVHITKIEVHNLIRAGKFTYDVNKNGTGSWEMLDSWGTYSKSFSVKVVNPLVTKQQVTDNDNSFILIPQSTTKTKWKTTATNPVSIEDADAAHQVYLAVYCKVFKETEPGSKVYDNCVWGNDDYKPIYMPLAKSWSKSNAATTIIFDIGKGYKDTGESWEPETGDVITFSESMLLESELDDSDNIDPWEDDNTDHIVNL
jgi:hypothetical protein